MSDEDALLNAIIAHPDEDTPRLAYADWLDENGNPDRAAFIRVQCRLADMPPSHPDWYDLTERQNELLVGIRHRPPPWGKTPRRFYFSTNLFESESYPEPFRRGFPHHIHCQTSDREWNDRELGRVIDELTRLVRCSTIRGFQPYDIPVKYLRELLAAPVTAELRTLSLSASVVGKRAAEATEFYRLVATSPALRGVTELQLYSGVAEISPEAVSALGEATAFDSLRQLTIQSLPVPKEVVDRLAGAPWFGRLRHFQSEMGGFGLSAAHQAAEPMADALGRLPELHTLDLPRFSPRGVAALAAGRFPALARLIYGGPLEPNSAALLAGARFPALAVFKGRGPAYGGHGGATDESLATLLKAGWFGRLRVLNLSGNAIGDKGLKALAAHPVAKSLRQLGLGDNAFGMKTFAALVKRGAFPALTALDLHSHNRRASNSEDLATFLSALRLTNLRHLNLENWPLGNAGAKALAANPSLANLARLDVSKCHIGDPGAKAIFASPHLQNLVQLHMAGNSIKSGADALADPSVMPRLTECWLGHNKVPEASAKTFKRDGMDLSV